MVMPAAPGTLETTAFAAFCATALMGPEVLLIFAMTLAATDAALGDAIVEYHIAHWDELGVDYIIWQQRMLSSPGGSWSTMENRGSPTANHMDHPHVNYLG